jgi:hypothetical protein
LKISCKDTKSQSLFQINNQFISLICKYLTILAGLPDSSKTTHQQMNVLGYLSPQCWKNKRYMDTQTDKRKGAKHSGDNFIETLCSGVACKKNTMNAYKLLGQQHQ